MDLTDPLFCFKIKCLFWLSLYHKQCVFSMEAHEKKYREKIKKLRKTIDKMVR